MRLPPIIAFVSALYGVACAAVPARDDAATPPAAEVPAASAIGPLAAPASSGVPLATAMRDGRAAPAPAPWQAFCVRNPGDPACGR